MAERFEGQGATHNASRTNSDSAHASHHIARASPTVSSRNPAAKSIILELVRPHVWQMAIDSPDCCVDCEFAYSAAAVVLALLLIF